MKLGSKWFLWLFSVAFYVIILGGFFFYRLFHWTFDEKLKQGSIEMVRVYAPTLLKGLQKNVDVITLDELDVMGTFSKDDRVAALLYLNKSGKVRWHKDASLMNMTYEDYGKKIGIPTNAIEQAYLSKSPKVREVPNQSVYDIAIPLSVRGDVLGIVDLQISRKGAESLIRSAMIYYFFGGLGVLFVLGFCLSWFMYRSILTPLATLRDALESLNVKNLDLKFGSRKDEIGDLAEVIGSFLYKIKTEMTSALGKEKQRETAEEQWWDRILSTIVGKGQKAIVVDEDNNVLHTNFPLQGGSAIGSKLHLLDIVDSQQQDLLRLVGIALDRPNELVEGDTVFHAEPCHVRVLHLKGQGEIKRTLILFEPKRAGSLTSVQRG
ncbi:MAG: hypothetical protein HY399_07590 [Elusimicrobia bacterium]|nr:hypothetical protein [Elusimicrobiota bacterium]